MPHALRRVLAATALAGLGLLAHATLPAPVALGQGPVPAGRGSFGRTLPRSETEIWLEDSLRWGGLVMPPAPGDCPATPLGPHRLPARPPGAWLGLVFADGRQSRWDSLSIAGGALYWPLERVCHALGVDVTWDPELMRGELLLADTLRCAFIVGAEFLHCGPRVWQMSAPALYLGNRVLLPLEFLDLMTRETLADRFRFRADSLLLVQRPAPGPLAALTSEQVGNRCYFVWKLADSRGVSFTTDGLASITVEVPGLRLDPGRPPRSGMRAAGCLWAVRPSPEGVAFVLRVDPSVRAWRIQTREQAGEVRLALSTNAADRTREGYRAWYPPQPAARGRAAGAVVLVLPDARDGDLAEAPEAVRSLLRDVAEQVRTRLAESGTRAVILETAGRSNWLRGVGAHQPAACICLLPDLAGHALLPGCRLMTGEPLPGERPQFPLDALSAPAGAGDGSRGGREAPLLRRWEAVAAAHAGGTHRLAWLMQLYLETAFPSGRFERGHWPGALLDGIDAPALAIYFGEPGGWTGEGPLGAPSDSALVAPPLPERLADAITGAVLMFLMGAQSG